MVWVEPKTKKPYILDGHQRINVIKSCNGEPYELPYIPIEAKNKVEAKKKLALVNSQYGRITRDGWDGFMHDVDVDWLRGMTTLEAFTLPPIEGFGKDFEPIGIENDSDNIIAASEKRDLSDSIVSQHKVEISCVNAAEQEDLYNRLINEGYECRILTF